MKTVKAKPIFYSVVYEGLKTIAKEYGYNLLIDGSLNRDLDLVLIPWVDNHSEPTTILLAFQGYLGGKLQRQPGGDIISEMSNGAGRKKAVIDLNRDSRFDLHYGTDDEQYYVDITIIQP